MAHHYRYDDEVQPDAGRELIYVPCPGCGRGVQLADENRLAGGPDTYECPSCGVRLAVGER